MARRGSGGRFLAALFGVTLPARRALAVTGAATGLAMAQAVAGDAAAGQALSVSLITAVAGVVVIVVARQTVLARELAASRRAVAAAAAQQQLSEVIEHLRPAGDEELAPALRRHVELWSRRTGVPAELTVDDTVADGLAAEPLLAVATEALTNVTRHSGARHVTLVLQAAEGQARLTVTDDGHGFDPAVRVPGQGLRGMAERLAQRRGSLDVRSGPGGTAQRHRPDVALIDLQMPGGDGVDAIRRIATSVPHTRLVVLTSHSTDADIFPAIRAGALSYLLKDVGPDALVATVRAAAASEAVLHPRVAARVVSELRGGHRDQPHALRDLTERELEVLRLVAEGLSNADIADRLVIGEKTVKTQSVRSWPSCS